MTGLLLLLTLAASDASSSFSSVVQESIAAAAAVEVEAMLIVQDGVDVQVQEDEDVLIGGVVVVFVSVFCLQQLQVVLEMVSLFQLKEI